jgi:hypothetical protein
MAKVAVKTSETVQGGAERLGEPGWYHMMVNHADINSRKGEPIDGFRVEFAVQHGSESGKTFEKTFFNPRLSDSEKAQAWAARKQTALLIAAGFMTESQLASDVDFDTDDMMGRQVVIHLVPDDQEQNRGKGYLDLAFADIFHVDDPRVAEKKIALNPQVLGLLPPALRRDPKSFDLEKLTGKKQVAGAAAGAGSAANGNGPNGSGGNGSAASSTQAQPVGVDLSDL